ncbi:MAG: addiction module antidote protein [Allosphingosinicella sp.]
MAIKLKPFDAAKYIEDHEDETELLNDAFASGHAGYIAAALGAVARAKGMTELAQKTGLNRQALYEALSANGNPTLDTIMRISCALGVELRAIPAGEGSPCYDEAQPKLMA